MHKHGLLILVALVILVARADQALAIAQFQKEFINLYVGEDKDGELAVLVKEAKCFVCHQGKKRENHNTYGIHLTELLDKKEDMKNPEKIIEALKKVEKLRSNPNDENSPTYLEIIQSGKLPGPTFEEAQKEPEELEL